MESSSSSSSHCCSSINPNPNARETITHDVFLSFRGGDTPCRFTSHLFAALKRRGIKVYIDYNLERGDEISCALLEAIERSRISIIIFSKNYARSKWSLDEMEKIMECKRGKGQIVIPIFYDVDPSEVRNQTGSYGGAFARHRKCFRASVNEKVQRWRDAMTEAANLSGWDASQYRMESELVDDIVNDVMRKLENLGVGDEQDSISMEQQATQPQSHNSSHVPNSDNSEDFVARNDRLNLKFEEFFNTLAHWVVKYNLYKPLIAIKSAIRYVRRRTEWNNILLNRNAMEEVRESERAEERAELFNYSRSYTFSDISISNIAEEARRRAEIQRLRELYTLKGRVESFAKLRGIDFDQLSGHYTV